MFFCCVLWYNERMILNLQRIFDLVYAGGDLTVPVIPAVASRAARAVALRCRARHFCVST